MIGLASIGAKIAVLGLGIVAVPASMLMVFALLKVLSLLEIALYGESDEDYAKRRNKDRGL